MTKQTPMRKFASSPTPDEEVTGRWMRFFSRQTSAPYQGPSANEVRRAGSSEKSSLMNPGMMGMGNSMYMRMVAMAAMTAVVVSFRTMEVEPDCWVLGEAMGVSPFFISLSSQSIQGREDDCQTGEGSARIGTSLNMVYLRAKGAVVQGRTGECPDATALAIYS